MKAAVVAAAALAGTGGGSLETLSGSARVLERGDRLVLVTGIEAQCRRGPCGWTVEATSRGRRLGSARGELAAGAERSLRLRIVPRLRPGARLPLTIEATLSPSAGPDVALVRTTRVRVPR